MPKWSKRVDANQATLVREFQAHGASVLLMHSLGGGAPDLAVGVGGRNHFVEVKNKDTSYGRAGLSESQRKWNRRWNGEPMEPCASVEDALRLLENWRKEE